MFHFPHIITKRSTEKKKLSLLLGYTEKNVYNVEKKHCFSCDNPFHQHQLSE